MKRFSAVLFFAVAAISVFAAPWDGKYDWRKVKTVAPGIVRAEWTFKKPRLIKVHALRIDLSNPKLRFHVTPRADKYGEKMADAPEYIIRTQRQTTRNFFKDLRRQGFRMVAAVNGAPWSPWRPPWNQKYADRLGALISDGEVVMPPEGKRPSLVVFADGKVDLMVIPAKGDLANIKQAISGFGFVLKDGNPLGANKDLAPRTGYGLSQDKRYLYIFVADGRQPKYSMGFTHREVGEFLLYLGAYNGLNMDGGGSSTMIIRKGKKEEMLNKQPRGGERTVGASLGISIAR